ncbi:MAG TPA: dTMP kinase [Thermoguttaceae bacterium]|nr:dTMP kinase [Thermoguttaceae bacterium]HPP52118.1 dTMP kinase [Thermoguttaceae bacterium]
MFIVLDGADGVGKSTQVGLLADWLRSLGYQVVTCRDPGSTPLGEAIRGLLLDRHDLHMALKAEMLLYMAARAQMVEEVIHPALAAGKAVVSDRYLLANVVYQGYGGGLDVDTLWEIGRAATGGLGPDLTIVLDVPPEVASARLGSKRDRIEARDRDFHARVRQGFLEEARRSPDQIVVLDSTGTVEQVQQQIQEILRRRGLVRPV